MVYGLNADSTDRSAIGHRPPLSCDRYSSFVERVYVMDSGEIRLSTINIDKLIIEWNKFETVTKSDDDCENNK